MDRPPRRETALGPWFPLTLWALALAAGYLWVW